MKELHEIGVMKLVKLGSDENFPTPKSSLEIGVR